MPRVPHAGLSIATINFFIAYASLVLLYSFLFFGIHFEEDSNIKFNALAALAIMISGWGLSAIPFLWKNQKNAVISSEAKAKNYALFATSLMWISPFIAELLVLLEWQLKGVFMENFENLVLGGNGFNDFLFVLGFATLVSSGLYALTSKKRVENTATDG